MALFQINDIIFNKDKSTPRGPLSALAGSNYEYNTYKYPRDLGAADKGHYVVFHINEQAKTQFPSSTTSGDLPQIVQNRKALEQMRGSTNIGGLVNNASNFAASINEKFKPLDKISQTLSSVGNSIGNIFGQSGKQLIQSTSQSSSNFIEGAKSAFLDDVNNSNFLRARKRTTDSIALYMPDTLQFDYQQGYTDISMSEGLLGLGLAAGTSLSDMVKKDLSRGELEKELGNKSALFATQFGAAKIFGQQGRVLAAGVTGVVQNPMLELLYTSPSFRTFQFDFKFYPRDRREGYEVVKIINRLRFHQAPEILKGTGGFFMVPPSEFDIKFFYNGKENPNIHKISTCVMTGLQVNFSPDGFATYEIPGELTPDFGGTGMPVSIQMVLTFKETEILTKESFSNDVGGFTPSFGTGSTYGNRDYGENF